jgi:hypothetical protein
VLYCLIVSRQLDESKYQVPFMMLIVFFSLSTLSVVAMVLFSFSFSFSTYMFICLLQNKSENWLLVQFIVKEKTLTPK